MSVSQFTLLVVALVVLAIGCYILIRLFPDLLELFAWPIGAALVGLVVYELIDSWWGIGGGAIAAILVLAVAFKD